MTDKKAKHPHGGHRKRLKYRYLQSKEESFSDHELLELLLFYSIPRANTNEIAHSLIERFGSISNMVEAEVDELKLVHGIGNNSAILLKLMLSLAKRYADEDRIAPKQLDCISKVVDLATQHTMGAVKELVFGVFMDDNFNIIDTNLIASGTVNEAKPMLRTIMELCVLKRATTMIVFHNHPEGVCEPSQADLNFTKMLERELSIFGVSLIEHVIVDGRGDYVAILKYIRDKNISIFSAAQEDAYYSK